MIQLCSLGVRGGCCVKPVEQHVVLLFVPALSVRMTSASNKSLNATAEVKYLKG